MAEGLEAAAETSASTCTWKREPCSVIFEIACDGGYIVNECFQNGGSSGVDVNEVARSVYGALHAKMDCSGQIHVSVDTNINYEDSSCKLALLKCMLTFMIVLFQSSLITMCASEEIQMVQKNHQNICSLRVNNFQTISSLGVCPLICLIMLRVQRVQTMW